MLSLFINLPIAWSDVSRSRHIVCTNKKLIKNERFHDLIGEGEDFTSYFSNELENKEDDLF